MSFAADQPAFEALRAIVAARTSPLLVWTGSGLSRAAALPTWAELKELLVLELEKKTQSLDPSDAEKVRSEALVIRHEQNYWISFQRIASSLGRTTYREAIRDILAPAATAAIPTAYELVWRLRPSVLLNLNLDRLATRAAASMANDGNLLEFSGGDVVRLRQHLHSPRALIGNLHGIVDDTDSWVLTHDQLQQLYANEAYRGFIEACISTHTVLFLGISIDDTAVGSHLARLAALNVETPTHYWVTSRRDLKTDRWAEEAGVRVIRYTAADESHTELQEALRLLISAVPDEDPGAPPVVSTAVEPDSTSPLPEPEELLALPAEEIRLVLNAEARKILDSESADAYDAYDAFIAKYDQAIYRAWYTSATEGSNVLLGYRLENEAAQGAFGRVYRATSAEGTVAVKVLREDIRRQGNLLRSFRRGVRSMRILGERSVQGMVSYRDASEIPAFVVMDWVDGPNLGDAVQSRYIDSWSDVLRIANDLAVVLRTAHFLPERVLHRDLRPSNIMLRGYYMDPADWEVVVLDFDLSWHRGAYEQSVIHTTTAGYLAPEQIQPVHGASTRHAAVDSFGLGMTLYYVCAKREPHPNQHRQPEWPQRVREACATVERSAWKSLPERFARLLLAMTADQQGARWDMSQIEREVVQLRRAWTSPDTVDEPEVIVEEIAARSTVLSDYRWEADAVAAVRSVPTGLDLALAARLHDETVAFTIRWGNTGSTDRQHLARYLPGAVTSAAQALRAAGWRIEVQESEWQALRVVATTSMHLARTHIDDFAALIDRATAPISRLS